MMRYNSLWPKYLAKFLIKALIEVKCTRIISLGGTDCIQSTVRSIFYNNRILNIIAAEF